MAVTVEVPMAQLPFKAAVDPEVRVHHLAKTVLTGCHN
jgi:hypothetical protein